MSLDFGPKTSSRGLSFCVDANNPKSWTSGSTVTNSVGSITGTLFNSSVNSGYFDFNGTTGYLQFSHSDEISTTGNELTVSCWVRMNSVNTQRGLVCKRSSTSAGSYWLFIDATNQIMWDTYQGSVQNRQTQNYSFAAGVWYNITCVYDAGVAGIKSIYVNDSNVSNTACSGSLTLDTSVLRIGSDSFASQYFTDGDIAMVKIYYQALTHDEIRSNYNAHKDRFGL